MQARIRRSVSCLVLAAVTSTAGCYDWVMVQPSELPRANGSYSEPVASDGTRTVVAVRVADLERPDGTLTRIRGEYDLRIGLRDGSEVKFSHPVRAERVGDKLIVRGGNRGATTFELSSIATAELSQFNVLNTAILSAALTLVLSVPLILLIPKK